MVQANLPAPIGRGYADAALPLIVQEALNDMAAAIEMSLDTYYGSTAWRTGGGGGGLTTAQVQSLINATALSALQGTVTDGQIPSAIMRDAEFTAAAVRSLLSLTATEVNDLLTGATIVGQILTLTQNDGSSVLITIPTAMAGTGDGVVQSGAFNNAGTELILTLDNGGTVQINVPALLRDTAGLTEAQVNTLIAATSLSALQGMVADGQIPSGLTRDTELAAAIANFQTAVEVQALINATSLSALQGQVTDGQIPAAIMRDAEFTAAAVRNLLNLTAAEVNDLLTGATIAQQILTFTQNDGSTVAITIPTAMAGTGDGVVQSGAFNDDQTELILTLDTGGTVTIDVPAALRASGGITQATADGLYARLAAANTFTEALTVESPSGSPLTVDGENSGNNTIMKIFTPDSGAQKAFGAGRDGEFDWVQFAGEIVAGKPGLALGPGTARDTNLYREEENHLKTDDAFTAVGDITTEGNVAAVGGTFTNPVTVPTPTDDEHAVNKEYADANDPWQGAWSATATYSDGDIFTHHGVQWLVHGGQADELIDEPVQYQERRADIQIIGTHWAALKTSINSDDVSTITSYFSFGQRWIFADERAFICVETGNYLHSDIPSSTGWKEIGAGGGGTITDAALDVADPSNESTTAGASRQSISEAIRAARGVISGEGGPPQATAELEGFIHIDLLTGDLAFCSNDPHTTSQASGTFVSIPTTTVGITFETDEANFPNATLDAWLYAPAVGTGHFYNGVTVAPGRVSWVQDTPQDALATDRSNNSFAIVWLGNRTNDEQAASSIGGALVANTDYFYFSGSAGRVRRLTLNTYSPAGGLVDHYNWAPPRADDYRTRVQRVEGGNLPAIPVDGTGDAWVRISDDGLYIVDVEHHPATTPTADSWATFADGTDYQGVAADDGDIAIAGTQYYFNSRHFTFRDTYIDTSLAVRYRDRTPPDGYIGHFDSRQDALNHAAARGIEEDDEFSAFTGSLVEEATNFTPAESFETTRDWVFVPVDAEGGGGDPGETVELYSNLDTAGVRLNVESGFGNTAANGGEFEFSRALVEADDDDILLIDIEYQTGPTSTRVTHYVNHFISARSFRERDAVAAGAANSDHTESVYVHRFGNSPAMTGWAEGRFIFGRGRNTISGNDILRLAAAANSTSPDITGVKVRVLLESVGGAAASEAETGGGQRRVARSVISSGTHLAITPRTFNPSTGTPGFAFSAVSIDDVPIAGLDSFSATIRIGDRAGFTMYLSKEQIEYAGRQNDTVWEFTDANNYTGGSVIPCLFLEGKHNTDNYMRTSIKPTRSQVGYIAGSNDGLSGVLIFFVYDPSNENINHVWTVAFSDVDVEVEEMHFHYLEDA